MNDDVSGPIMLTSDLEVTVYRTVPVNRLCAQEFEQKIILQIIEFRN